uniref:Thiosulfate sulfurtransferase n=1 Tax=Coturnix japonica TaxID=93934 RepID=A0A8C2TSB7_COTJA
MAAQALGRALVSAKWLSEAVRAGRVGAGLRVLDASWYPPQERNARQEFRERHIPGASFFDIEECRDKSSPYDFMLPSEAHFADYVGRLGVGNDTHVVVYDGDQLGTFYAPRAWWMFRVFGHREVSVLNGGFKNWVKEGHPVTAELSQPTPAVFKAKLDKTLLKTFEEMMENVGSKKFQVVDSRPAGRFQGTELDQGLESGHIPGAVNMPFSTFLSESGHEKSIEEIQQMFREKKVDLSKPLTATCRKDHLHTQRDLPACRNHRGTTSGTMDQVREAITKSPTSPRLDVAQSDSVPSNNASVEPEEEKKERLPAGLSPTRQRTTSHKTPSRVSCKVSKSSAAQGTTKKNSTHIKSKNHHSRRLEEEEEDTSATKDPRMRLQQRGRNSISSQSASSRQREAENTKSMPTGKELVEGRQQTPRSKMPGSLTKARCEKTKETNESLTAVAPDRKAEWKEPLEKKNSVTRDNSKNKFASVDEFASNEEERRSLCLTALIMGQKRLSDRTGMLKRKLESFGDFNELGFNLRSNIFQGGPLECRSLMKDSYTPDVIQKSIRDPRNWHGRRIDDLGRWHQKNALNLSLQKALENKYGKKKAQP